MSPTKQNVSYVATPLHVKKRTENTTTVTQSHYAPYVTMKTTCLTIASVRQRMTNDKCTKLAACIVNGCSRQTMALLLLSSSMGFGTERQRLIEENRQKDYISPFEER